jgi:hypothetical protein
MAGWTVPAELDQPLPRIVKRRRVFVGLVISQALGFLVIAAFFGGTVGTSFYKMG